MMVCVPNLMIRIVLIALVTELDIPIHMIPPNPDDSDSTSAHNLIVPAFTQS